MDAFRLLSASFDTNALRAELADPHCGGHAAFEGWVRDHNEGRHVRRLEYEAFAPLAIREGERIAAEAMARFGVTRAICAHRVGELQVGELAVWVGVSAPHRDEAFRACRYIIDEVKHRVPIWKKEHYADGDSGWVNCERCAAAPSAGDHDPHSHSHHGHSHAPLRPDYSRQVALPEVGESGQARLRAASVLVIGAGGLGVPVLQYLGAAGIGRLGIVDVDVLEPSNLHRQTWYALADCGQPKAELAAARVRALNPEVEVRVHPVRFDAANAAELIEPHDIVVDCTDNFATKFLLSDLVVRTRKVGVFGSVYQYEGQLQVVDGRRPDGPCLRCAWPEATRDGLVGNCAEAGVLGPVPGVLGNLQALEVLKIVLGLEGRLVDEVLMLDLLSLSTRRLALRAGRAHPAHAAPDDSANSSRKAALEIEFPDLASARAAGYTLIDVRDPAEWASAPLEAPGAIQRAAAQLAVDASGLDPAGHYLLVCARGARSLAACVALHERGHAGVRSLRGGLSALQARV